MWVVWSYLGPRSLGATREASLNQSRTLHGPCRHTLQSCFQLIRLRANKVEIRYCHSAIELLSVSLTITVPLPSTVTVLLPSTVAASNSTVGIKKMSAMRNLTFKVSLILPMARVASNEFPPMLKKLSRIPTLLIFRMSHHTDATCLLSWRPC